MTLDELSIGDSARIVTVGGEGALRRRLLDMGLTPKTKVTVRKMAPMGDPIELHLRGYELTLRAEDARKIQIDSGAGAAARPQNAPSHGQAHGHHHGHGRRRGQGQAPIQANWQWDAPDNRSKER